MDLGLQGKVAVVTGGSAGIGRAIVAALAQEGARVHFCARGVDRLAETERACGTGVTGTRLDVTDADAVRRWLTRVGRIDIAIANVSAMSGNWAEALPVDLAASVNVMEAAIAQMPDGGAVTYIGSKAASLANPGYEAYGAVKAAMAHFVRSAATRYAARGVRVNTVSPGDTFAEGGFWDRMTSEAPQMYADVLAANPMGRFATPDEIARVVVFISSPAASFVSGANWYVDGGSLKHVQF